MKRLLLILPSLFLFWATYAQLQNPSFERTDSLGAFSTWSLKQGIATQISSAQFGVIPFIPFEGNFFALLNADTTTSNPKRALFEQSFSFADTPGNISLAYFYLPESLDQHGTLTMLMSSWNGSSRDTLLYFTDTLVAVTDSHSIRIQWNIYTKTLKGLYRSHNLPDSAWIQLSNDDGAVAGKNIRLYLDAIQFGKWAVGADEQDINTIQVYPNPANELLVIQHTPSNFTYSLTDITGKIHHPAYTLTENGLQLNLQSLPNGLYYLRMRSNSSILNKPILINHAE